MSKLAAVRQKLYALKPQFCSVTYGAGGSTPDGSFGVVKLGADIPVMPGIMPITNSSGIVRFADTPAPRSRARSGCTCSPSATTPCRSRHSASMW